MTQTSEARPGKGRGRKPAHIYHSVTGCDLPYETIWIAIRQMREFTTASLCSRLVRNKVRGVNDDTIKSYLERLTLGGYIRADVIDSEETGPRVRGCARAFRYTLINDVGVEAPRLTAEGKPSHQGRGTENMWRSMKALKSFDFRELANASSTATVTVPPATAKRYLHHLHDAGYLVELKPATHKTPAKYKLLSSKNTGPKAPMVQRSHRVYDPNLKKVMWQEEVDA